ncbi:MAG: reverse transcriptase domain-containing protein [Ramlibacter sp.]|nr:reverse transcriptase domain-containing protein [Ramlibacter sp.]
MAAPLPPARQHVASGCSLLAALALLAPLLPPQVVGWSAAEIATFFASHPSSDPAATLAHLQARTPRLRDVVVVRATLTSPLRAGTPAFSLPRPVAPDMLVLVCFPSSVALSAFRVAEIGGFGASVVGAAVHKRTTHSAHWLAVSLCSAGWAEADGPTVRVVATSSVVGCRCLLFALGPHHGHQLSVVPCAPGPGFLPAGSGPKLAAAGTAAPLPPAALEVVGWNCHSVALRRAEVLALVGAGRILALGETWLAEDACAALVRPWGLCCVARRERIDRTGGGVALVWRAGLFAVSPLPRPGGISTEIDFAAAVFVPVAPLAGLRRVVVAVVYVPPSVGVAAVAAVAAALQGLRPDVVVGDLNARHPSWCPTGLANPAGSQLARSLAAAPQPLRLLNVVARPATTPEGTGLDLGLVGPSLAGASLSVLPTLMGSDHFPVCVSWSPPPQVPRTATRVAIAFSSASPAQWAAFSAAAESLSLPCAARSVDWQARSVAASLLVCARRNLARCRVDRRPRPGFVPPPLRPQAQAVADLWAAVRAAPLDADLFRRALAADGALVAALRAAAEADALRRASTSAGLWGLWRSTDSSVAAAVDPLADDGSPFASPAAAAAAFAAAFAAKQRCRGLRPDPAVPPDGVCEPVSAAEIDAAIAATPRKWSVCPQGLVSPLLSRLGPGVRAVLAALFSRVLAADSFPHCWSVCVVVPLPKPGKDHTKVDGFRPVGLLPVLSRLLERVVLARLRGVAAALSPLQCGFRPGRDAALPVAHLLRDLQDARRVADIAHEEGRQRETLRQGLVLAVDLTDAFCCVAAADILAGLLRLGAAPPLIRFVRRYLAARSLCVRWRGVRSGALPTLRGVVQGSVLGPLLFAAVVDNLLLSLAALSSPADDPSLRVRVGAAAFADDISLWSCGPPSRLLGALQPLADVVSVWSASRGVPVSGKTQALHTLPLARAGAVPPPALGAHLVVGGVRVVVAADPIRILGVWVDATLSFGAHAERVLLRTAPLLARLDSLAVVLLPRQLRLLLFGAVLPALLWGAHAWWPLASVACRVALQDVQVSAARIAAGCYRTVSAAAALGECRLPSLAASVACVAATRAAAYVALPPCPAVAALLRPPQVAGVSARDVVARAALRTDQRAVAAAAAAAAAAPPPQPPRRRRRAAVAVAADDDGPAAAAAAAPAHVAAAARLQGPGEAPVDASVAWSLAGLASAAAALSPALRLAVLPPPLPEPGRVSFRLPPQGAPSLPPGARRAAGLRLLAGVSDDDVVVATDASVVEGVGGGGGCAAALWLPGIDAAAAPPSQTSTVSLSLPLCSFSAEATSLSLGLSLGAAVAQTLPPTGRVVVLADSLSVLSALVGGPLRASDALLATIWWLVVALSRVRPVVLCFVHAHCGIPPNEVVDRLAAAARAAPPLAGRRPWWGDVARSLRSPLLAADDAAQLAVSPWRATLGIPQRVPLRLGFALCRADARVAACLRTGAWRHLPGWSAFDPPVSCRLCGAADVWGRQGRSLRHLFACAAPEVVALRVVHGVAADATPLLLWRGGRKELFAVVRFAWAVGHLLDPPAADGAAGAVPPPPPPPPPDDDDADDDDGA